MQPFDLPTLLWPATVIFVATVIVAFRVTRAPAFSLCAALIKAGVYLLYFGYAFDGTYTFLDDWSYLEGGEDLLAAGVGITNLAEHWNLVLVTGRGDHFVYYLYNTYAFRLFGVGYYAPVALNILITLVVSFIGARLAHIELRLSRQTTKLFFAFLLLHPDIFAWSNVMNGKDILVLLLHVLLLYSASLFIRLQTRTALLLAAPVSIVLLFLRFYVPILVAIAFVASLLSARRAKRRVRLVAMASVMFAVAAAGLGEAGFQYAIRAMQEHFVNPIYGFVRMALTPIPFNTDEAYAFLNIPAAIHWALMPFVVLGIIRVHRLHTPYSRFLLLYAGLFLALYAVFGELQGPRHRVQLDYAWAVFQFMGLLPFLFAAAQRTRRCRSEAGEQVALCP